MRRCEKLGFTNQWMAHLMSVQGAIHDSKKRCSLNGLVDSSITLPLPSITFLRLPARGWEDLVVCTTLEDGLLTFERNDLAVCTQAPPAKARGIPWAREERSSMNLLNSSLVLDCRFFAPLPPAVIFPAWEAGGATTVIFDVERQ